MIFSCFEFASSGLPHLEEFSELPEQRYHQLVDAEVIY